MADTLNTDPIQRHYYPYAVGIKDDDAPSGEVYLHYESKRMAQFMAYIMGPDTTKWVSTDASVPLAEGDNGWRKVSEFVL